MIRPTRINKPGRKPTLPREERHYLTLDELAAIFNMLPVSARNAISMGRFPVKTYRMCGQRVADKAVVEEYFAQRRREGMEHIAEAAGL